MDESKGFCHRHPTKEENLNLDKDHVIIDRKDWMMVREMNLDCTCQMCGKNVNTGGKHQEKKLSGVYRNSNWVCDECIEEILKKERRD